MLAALGMNALDRWHAGLVLSSASARCQFPTILGEYNKPREDWRAANNAILSSASPGDAVVFFRSIPCVLDYYRDRYSGQTPILNVFAPQYYDGGNDIHSSAEGAGFEPTSIPHVWVVVYGTDAASRISITAQLLPANFRQFSARRKYKIHRHPSAGI